MIGEQSAHYRLHENIGGRSDVPVGATRFSIEGDGRNVKAVVKPLPIVTLDPIYPKQSIVGWPTTFQFKDWDTTWKLVSERKVPDQADFDALAHVVDFSTDDSAADSGEHLLEYALGALVKYLGEERTTAVARLYNVLGRLKLSLTAERLEETVAAIEQYFISESRAAELSAHGPTEEART